MKWDFVDKIQYEVNSYEWIELLKIMSETSFSYEWNESKLFEKKPK